jgi:DNA-binding HxlR family transcriptional regulator
MDYLKPPVTARGRQYSMPTEKTPVIEATLQASGDGWSRQLTDFSRLELMRRLASGPKTLNHLKKSMSDVSSRELAKTLANAAREGLLELNDHTVSLTPFGYRVFKNF